MRREWVARFAEEPPRGPRNVCVATAQVAQRVHYVRVGGRSTYGRWRNRRNRRNRGNRSISPLQGTIPRSRTLEFLVGFRPGGVQGILGYIPELLRRRLPFFHDHCTRGSQRVPKDVVSDFPKPGPRSAAAAASRSGPRHQAHPRRPIETPRGDSRSTRSKQRSSRAGRSSRVCQLTVSGELFPKKNQRGPQREQGLPAPANQKSISVDLSILASAFGGKKAKKSL